VAVFAQAKEEQVMAVDALAHALCNGCELGFTLCGCLVWVDFALNLEHVSDGEGNSAEQRFEGHVKIAVRAVRRDAPLVAKGDLDALPGEVVGAGSESLVDGAGCASPGKAKAEHAGTGDGFPTGFNDEGDGVLYKVGST
jgi:hypothetical protein